ncbi:MAG TPA: ABC transporter ATP-binding protein [Rhizomicrobium sp.]|jgi:ATP-binding cassette subfamily B protein|nr:ABC transporter ATP-binding protein [Rhizomicrobium sp.]
MMRWSPPSGQPSLVTEQFRLAKPFWKRLGSGFVLLMIGVAAQLAYPRFIAYFLDHALAGMNGKWLAGRIAFMAAAVAVQTGAVALHTYLFSSAGTLIVFRLRTCLFGAIIRQEIGFFDSQSVGELMSRLAADVEQLRNSLSKNVAFLAQALLTVVGCVFMMFTLSPLLSVFMMLSAPPVALVARWIGRRVRELAALRQQKLAECSHVAHEALTNIRLVHAYDQDAHEREQYAGAANSAREMSLSCDRLFAGFYSVECLLHSAALLIAFWIGIVLVGNHRLTVGNLTSFILYALMVISSATTASSIWNDWMQSAGATRRVFELMKREPRVRPTTARSVAQLKGDIEFRDVTFAYPMRPQQLALDSFDLSVIAGERVALVGPSGAGKSTVISLLLGFYEPLSGAIRFDGIAAEELGLPELRRHIAIVEQEPALFAGTIIDNIRYAAPDGKADEADVVRAARHANVHDFVSKLPLGYETQVGSRGLQLSGGQKQRIAIARALLRNPRILVLDEATSALDSENEEKVQIALRRLMEARTTIIVSHRLSTIAYADRLIVMNGGRVVQSGTHRQLLGDENGWYSSAMRNQISAEWNASGRHRHSGEELQLAN